MAYNGIHMSRNLPPLILQPISAGFPNPAQDPEQEGLDLNELVVKHPAATFYMRVEGTSMEGAHIFSGDIVVVDKALEPRSNDIVVAYVDGEFTLKRFQRKGDKGYLVPENAEYEPREVTADSDFRIWGVVSYIIHATR